MADPITFGHLNVNCDTRTFNSDHLKYEDRLPVILQFFSDSHPTIITINELRNFPDHSVQYVQRTKAGLESLGYHVVSFRNNESPLAFHSLIAVRKCQGQIVSHQRLWPSPSAMATDEHVLSDAEAVIHDSTDCFPRAVGVCEVCLLGCQETIIVATFHASIDVEDKQKQMSALSRLGSMYPDRPILLSGDFNMFNTDDVATLCRPLADAAFREVLFSDALEMGTFLPFSVERRYDELYAYPPERLDRLFLRPADGVALETDTSCNRTVPVMEGSGLASYRVPPFEDSFKDAFPKDGLASDHLALLATFYRQLKSRHKT